MLENSWRGGFSAGGSLASLHRYGLVTIALAFLHGKDPAAIQPIRSLKAYLEDKASIQSS